MTKICLLWNISLSVVLFGGMTGCVKQKITIATDFKPEILSDLKTHLETAVSRVDVQWLNTEQSAKADLVLTTSPTLISKLRKLHRIQLYPSRHSAEIHPQLQNPEGYEQVVAFSLMILAYNPFSLKPEMLPHSWSHLNQKQWKNQLVQIHPDYAEDYRIAQKILETKFGKNFFSALETNQPLKVITPEELIQSLVKKDKSLGIVKLEDILSHHPPLPIKILYPVDGVVILPRYLAMILKETENQSRQNIQRIQQTFDWMLSPLGQNLFVHHGFYSPQLKIVSPVDAQPWSELQHRALIQFLNR